MANADREDPPSPASADGGLAEQMKELRSRVEQLSGELQSARNTISLLHDRVANPTDAHFPRPDTEPERRRARQLERQAMILKRDHAIARKLQESLRPLWLGDFPDLEFAVRSLPGVRVGGDFYDVIKVSETSIALLVADVSGSGLPAAVIMAMARMAFRTFVTLESSPRAIMEKVNGAMIGSTLAGHHLTAFLALLDVDLLTLQYVNASSPTPYLIRNGELIALDTNGFFVGMFEDPQYEQKSIQLSGMDKLFMFTDGLLALLGQGAGGQAADKVRDFLHQNASLRLSDLMRRLNARLVRGAETDLAILAVELLRDQARAKVMTIASIPSEVARVENTILPVLDARGYGERAIFAVKLAIEEAVMNAIKHGNQLDSTKRVHVEFEIDDEKAVVRVEDEGEGFRLEDVPDPTLEENLDSTSGRGIALMRAYADSVEFNEKGNAVTMTKFSPWKMG